MLRWQLWPLRWLLFAKDSLGNGEKNIDIKPLNAAGEVADHQAITSVEAEFAVNGVSKTFRRTYREVWATKRGTGEPEYTGNTSDYFVDGVPMKKNAFDDAIRDLVGEDRFRMLTSVSWFASGMKWQERRAVLFELAGAMSDKDIMAGKVKRKGWNGKSQHIELARSISYIRCNDGEQVNCEHDAIGNMAIAFVGTSGVQMGWLASQADMLAEDWVFAE